MLFYIVLFSSGSFLSVCFVLNAHRSFSGLAAFAALLLAAAGNKHTGLSIMFRIIYWLTFTVEELYV